MRKIMIAVLMMVVGITSVNAKELEMVSIKPTEETKSSTKIEIQENEEKSFDVIFKDVEEKVKYEVVIRNTTEKELEVEEIEITKAKNTSFSYNYEEIEKDYVIGPQEEKKFYLVFEYKKNESIEPIYNEEVEFSLGYQDKGIPQDKEVENPKTGVESYIISIIALGGFVVCFIIYRKDLTKFKYMGVFFVMLAVIPILTNTLAKPEEDKEIRINGIIRNRVFYEVKIDPNGGRYEDSEEIKVDKVMVGSKIKLGDITRDTYEFVEWEVNPSSVEIKDNEIEVTENIALKALWNELYYTLTIDPNTGIYEGINEEINTKVRPNTVVNLSVPEKEGYNFNYWTKDNNEEYRANTITINKDTKLVANYEKKKYQVRINPNGGLFNNNSEVYEEIVEHGSKIDLSNITRDRYNFLGWTDGVNLINENEITVTDNINLTATWEIAIKYEVKIDPNGGIYDKSKETSTYTLKEGSIFKIDDVTREGYILDHWETEDGEIVTKTEFVVLQNVTLVAKWEEIVCRIENTNYSSIMKAYEAAKSGDTIILLKDTLEVVENKKKITLDLGGYKVTGSLTNTGDITIINGTIENPDGIAIINNGTLTLGINDYNEDASANIINDYVKIIGSTVGIEQNNIFNYYDGYIEGDIGLEGGYNNSPEYRNTFDNVIVKFYPFVDHNTEKNCQHIELESSDKAVSKTKINGEIYYYNLQDNINTSIKTGYLVYAVRDFEASYSLNIPENEEVTIDISGMIITLGDDITNNGIFNIIDTGNEKGMIRSSKGINNMSNLVINDSFINKINDGDLISNTGNINMTNSKISALNGNAIIMNPESTLELDDKSILQSNTYALNVTKDEVLTITQGTIYGINNFGTLTITGGIINNTGNNNTIFNNSNATLTIESGLIKNTTNYGVRSNGILK
ncbi:MAG: InlB B-repeat-containing protein, partial [Bacilli bacterium]|nr:InlB B-repeat-containing protein [Bacilli bacterium]